MPSRSIKKRKRKLERKKYNDDEKSEKPVEHEHLELKLKEEASTIAFELYELCFVRSMDGFFHLEIACHHTLTQRAVKYAQEVDQEALKIGWKKSLLYCLLSNVKRCLKEKHHIKFKCTWTSNYPHSSNCTKLCAVKINLKWACICRSFAGYEDCDGCDVDVEEQGRKLPDDKSTEKGISWN